MELLTIIHANNIFKKFDFQSFIHNTYFNASEHMMNSIHFYDNIIVKLYSLTFTNVARSIAKCCSRTCHIIKFICNPYIAKMPFEIASK